MKNYITYFLLLCFSFAFLSAQDEGFSKIEKNPIGTEFWLCFMKNHEDPKGGDKRSELHLELFISSTEDTEVTVEIFALGFSKTVYVKKNEITNVKIDKLAQITSSEVIENGRAVHIVSEKPISVYGLNRRRLTTDTFLGLPTNVLGTEYRAMCYSVTVALMAEFAIVATEDNTKINITPTVETQAGKKPGQKFSVILDEGDVYQVTAKNILQSELNCDLTGSLITADKKIAVFSGHQCSYIPFQPLNPIIACNHLVEQMPPIPSWGKHYYIGKLEKRSNYNYRVLANEDSTKIFENSKYLATINAGEFIERIRKQPIQVTANKAILVSQYSQGYRNGDSIGDPMMLLISPTQQFLKKYRFATPVNGSWNHFINVVIPSNAIRTLIIDGKKVPSSKFSAIGKSRYSIAYLEVEFGAHTIRAGVPFGMTSYGFGYGKDDQFDAYGTIGGQSFLEYQSIEDTLAPEAVISQSEAQLEDGSAEMIFRDDRENDLGIKSVEIISAENFNYNIPRLIAGTPQILFKIKVAKQKTSTIIFKVSDLNNNEQIYSVCYEYIDGKYVYNLSKGENYCSDPEMSYGCNIAFTSVSHSSNLSLADAITDNTNSSFSSKKFNSASEVVYFFSMLGKYKINQTYSARASIGLGQINGDIESTVNSNILFEGALHTFTEEYKISLTTLSYNFRLGGEYHYKKLYFGLGYQAYLLSNDVELSQSIITPLNKAYGNGKRTKILNNQSFDNMNSFLNGFYTNIGSELAIYNNIYASLELEYEMIFTEINDGSDWKFNKLGLAIGLRYKL